MEVDWQGGREGKLGSSSSVLGCVHAKLETGLLQSEAEEQLSCLRKGVLSKHDVSDSIGGRVCGTLCKVEPWASAQTPSRI